MKQILSIILFSLFFSTSALSQSKTEADTLYTKEKYEEAANMYEKILATQGEAAEIYYNLGNCYYKLDNVPYSILNYERALMLDPGDGDIRANLALARARTVDRVTPPSEMFFRYAAPSLPAIFIAVFISFSAYSGASNRFFPRWNLQFSA